LVRDGTKSRLKAQDGATGIASHVCSHAAIEHNKLPQGLRELYNGNVYHVQAAILLRDDWDRVFDKYYIFIDTTKEYQIFYCQSAGYDIPEGAVKGMKLRLPTDMTKFPPPEAFNWHRDESEKKHGKGKFGPKPPTQ